MLDFSSFFPMCKTRNRCGISFVISTAVYRSGGTPLSKTRLHINYLPCKYCRGCGIRVLEVVSDHKISPSFSNVSITNLSYLYFQNGRYYSQSDLTLPRSKQMFSKLKNHAFFLQSLSQQCYLAHCQRKWYSNRGVQYWKVKFLLMTEYFLLPWRFFHFRSNALKVPYCDLLYTINLQTSK